MLNPSASPVPWRWFLSLPALAFLVLVPGCGEQPQIRTYDVEKSARNLAPAGSSASVPKLEPARMLAAMMPRGGSTWFFKVTGPPEQIETQVDAFKELISSVEFPKPDEPAWTLPEGWTQAGGGLRYATITIPGPPALEVSVISLGGEQDVLENVNRWRKQVLLLPISQDEVGGQIEQIPTKDGKALMVDLLGRQESKGGGRPMAGRAPFLEAMAKQQNQSRPPAQTQPSYDVPKAWMKVPTPPSRFSPVIETYEVKQGGNSAKITTSRMFSQAGLWLANINRWRVDELKMKPIGQQQLDETFSPIQAGNLLGRYVKLQGENEAVLVGIFDVGGNTWFFKMIGDAGFVIEKEAEFKTFVQSVRFSNEEAGDE